MITTLQQFLSEHSICRVWWVSVGSPAGMELQLNTDDNAADEDYCDSQSLMECLPEGAEELEGEVSKDSDGEYRWEVKSLQDSGVTDFQRNTLLNLKVWAN